MHLTMTVAMFVIIATVCVMLSFLHGTAKVRICTLTRAFLFVYTRRSPTFVQTIVGTRVHSLWGRGLYAKELGWHCSRKNIYEPSGAWSS